MGGVWKSWKTQRRTEQRHSVSNHQLHLEHVTSDVQKLSASFNLPFWDTSRSSQTWTSRNFRALSVCMHDVHAYTQHCGDMPAAGKIISSWWNFYDLKCHMVLQTVFVTLNLPTFLYPSMTMDNAITVFRSLHVHFDNVSELHSRKVARLLFSSI